MTPDSSDLWFLPLGGCGEIGMNLNLYGHDERWLMVDCGVTFDHSPGTASALQMADPSFIRERRGALVGLVVTHAHEDHVGAVPHLWKQLRCPIYTTAFTAEVLRRKLTEKRLVKQVPVHIVDSGGRREVGPFDIEWLPLTHSIPESHALVIRTGAGTVFHTADWKLDPDPVIGNPCPPERLQALAGESIDAIVCDSTNAVVAGRSQSEAALQDGLEALVSAAPARVIVTCFASNLARLHTLALVARATGRHIALIGRSLQNMLAAAKAAGVWSYPAAFVDADEIAYLPRDKVLTVVTGSQGETRGALARLAADAHPQLSLDRDDTVLFSSRVIPGNEDAVNALVERLQRAGVRTIQAHGSNLPIHASGHPAADELDDMYRWVRPALAIPVHGEEAHMRANASIARAAGVPRQLTGWNGDLFYIAPVKGIRRKAVATGRLGLRGDHLVALT